MAKLLARDDTTAPRLEPARAPRPSAALARLPWALLCVLAPLLLLAHSLGAPLGQAVAEDFDFLHDALFSSLDLLNGGGSASFWRPISHQLYYRLLSPLILDHPGAVAA